MFFVASCDVGRKYWRRFIYMELDKYIKTTINYNCLLDPFHRTIYIYIYYFIDMFKVFNWYRVLYILYFMKILLFFFYLFTYMYIKIIIAI